MLVCSLALGFFPSSGNWQALFLRVVSWWCSMDGHLNCGPLPGTGGDLPARKRGRPPIPASPEVLERRIMSRQRANASQPKVKDGDLPTRKRGRPPIPITDEVLERRRISRQRVNASRPKSEGPTRKRGRPKRAATEVILDPHPLSRTVVPHSCQKEDTSAGTSQTLLASDQNPPTSSGPENASAGTSQTFCSSYQNPLDFLVEAKNSAKCMDNFQKLSPRIADHVYAPRVYWNLSTSKLLTMEYVGGAHINDLKG